MLDLLDRYGPQGMCVSSSNHGASAAVITLGTEDTVGRLPHSSQARGQREERVHQKIADIRRITAGKDKWGEMERGNMKKKERRGGESGREISQKQN